MRIECERKRNIEGEISGDEARRLVDEYYGTRLGHGEPTGHPAGDRLVPDHETRPARFSPMTTFAFTCTGPYAILIMLGIKRVENRSAMPVSPKGRCAVSCSKSFCAAEYGAFVYWASMNLPPEDFERIPSWVELKDWPGKVVGCCDYAAHGRNDLVLGAEPSASRPWDEGYEYWWDLSEIVRFERPIPCRGNVGMWQMPSALAAQVTAADALAKGRGEADSTAARANFVKTFDTPLRTEAKL